MPAAHTRDPRFPRPHTDAHVAKVASALTNTAGVTLTDSEAVELARLTTTKSGELVNRRGQIADERLHWSQTQLGGRLLFLETQTMPSLSSPANPRIAPAMVREYNPMRPPRPSTPPNATHMRFDYADDAELARHHSVAVRELRAAATEAVRGYDLLADMAHRGQREMGTSALTVISFQQGGRAFHQPRLMSAKGNNRSQARLSLLGLSFNDVIYGAADPRQWWDNYLSSLAQIEQIGDPAEIGLDPFRSNPMLFEAAQRLTDHGIDAAIRNLATRTLVLVGWDPASGDLAAQLDELNLDDHLHPPAEFNDNARGIALMSTIIQVAQREGLITPAKASALLGHTDLSAGGFVNESARRLEMIRILFPQGNASTPMRRIVQNVLAEPVGTRTNNSHAQARCRVLGATWFNGQRNPRLADDLFTSVHTRAGVDIPWVSTEDLIAAAPTDADAAAFLTKIGPLLLAEVGLFEASRGSNPLRRSPNNLVRALDRDRTTALPVLTEAVDAAKTGRPPELAQPDGSMVLLDERWIATTFPQRAVTTAPPAPPVPVAPPDPAAEMRFKEDQALTAMSELTSFARSVVDLLREVREFANTHSLPIPSSYANELDNRQLVAYSVVVTALQAVVNETKIEAQNSAPLVTPTTDDDDGIQ
jgi:hypothetical protein